MKSFVFDIDGTICPLKSKDEEYIDLVPHKEIVEYIKDLKAQNFKIVLFTARNMKSYNGDTNLILKNTLPIIEKWLQKWDIPYDEIYIGKPWPGEIGFYVDDRAIRPKELLNNNLEELNLLCERDRL